MSVNPPSFVVAVMVAVPSPTPLIIPFETVATDVSDDVHVIPFFVASNGVITAFTVTVLPFSTVTLSSVSSIPVTATLCGVSYVTFVYATAGAR